MVVIVFFFKVNKWWLLLIKHEHACLAQVQYIYVYIGHMLATNDRMLCGAHINKFMIRFFMEFVLSKHVFSVSLFLSGARLINMHHPQAPHLLFCHHRSIRRRLKWADVHLGMNGCCLELLIYDVTTRNELFYGRSLFIHV